MKKGIILMLIAALMVPAVGCAKSEPVKTEVNINVNDKASESTEETEKEAEVLDAKAIADSLKNDIKYKDELTAIDLDTAAMFYDFSSVEIEESYIYESSGATAEEIVVLKCKDADNAKKAEQLLSARLDEQMENYEDYVPEEVVKIRYGVVSVKDNIAVLSVSDEPEKAKDILK